MIAATVTVKTATNFFVYDDFGNSVEEISAEAEKLIEGDEPFGISVLVLQ